jgi:hypothetical protein
MRILLLAMPDTASLLDRLMKFPNLGLCSLAAQVPEHEVRILDLVLRPLGVCRRVLDEVAAFGPDLVGYSAMSFQYDTARALAASVRAAAPGALHVLGGYHATVLAKALLGSARGAAEPLPARLPGVPQEDAPQQPGAVRRPAEPPLPLDAHALTARPLAVAPKRRLGLRLV